MTLNGKQSYPLDRLNPVVKIMDGIRSTQNNKRSIIAWHMTEIIDIKSIFRDTLVRDIINQLSVAMRVVN